jgi:hypothetical protein
MAALSSLYFEQQFLLLELLIGKCERTCWTVCDTIYVLDLHGSTMKNEVGLDRSKDEMFLISNKE